MKRTIFILIFIIMIFCGAKQTQIFHPSKKTSEAECLNCGEIKPMGWIKKQMQHDLKDGFVGHLDQLVPDLIVEDDIYGKDRLTKNVKSKDVGSVTGDGEWEVQFLWWNSETQSNWWDGYIRHAILLQDKTALEKVKRYIEKKLATQDKDGYLGIYAEDLRYKHSTEKGELWAQATLLRGLLAYYEFTKDKKVLDAIKKAVQRTMKAYPINASEPFNIEKPNAGVGHGLTSTDVLDRLYQLTGNSDYRDYAVFLYADYNKHSLAEVDIQMKNLLNTEYRFKGHGVHTYEHLRGLTIAAYNSTDSLYIIALEKYLKKLDEVLCPSGAPIGDEWICERTAQADSTGYEYCSIQELLDSYGVLLQKSGDPKWADKVEWLLFNAAQGARHPDENAIAYCKTDNSYHMSGALDLKLAGAEHQNKYKYSPSHQDVAVCCVPNAGRVYPYYIKNMWFKTPKGLQLNLFGPSKLITTFKGSKIKITQKTNYPFDLNITLKIELEKELEFEIDIRKPKWIKDFKLTNNLEYSDSENYITLSKNWIPGDEIHISFITEPIVHKDFQERNYISYGPLIFALELDGKKKIIKEHPVKGFYDLHYEPIVNEKYNYKWIPNAIFTIQKETGNRLIPWTESIWLNGSLYNPKTQKPIQVKLKPMGNTILRKVSFQRVEESARL